MPMVSTVNKKRVEMQFKEMERLQWKCEESIFLKGKVAEEIFCYFVCGDYESEDGPALITIAKFGDVYAMSTPLYLKDEQMVIFEFVLRDVEPHETVIVFNKRDYEAAEKYAYGKKFDLKLSRR